MCEVKVYPVAYITGTHASLYWTYFEGAEDTNITIPMGKEISLYDIKGDNIGHKDAEPYYPNGFGHALPRGEYKIVMVNRYSGEELARCDFTIE